jgi:GT2 family glycosyltransferase/sugar lactone lactonase YvrE
LTYVNFPPTEYLDLDAFDVCAFNVYLHSEPDLRAYLARLQHIAGARPLLLAEAGADSVREGRDGQARLTASQVRAAFAEGACGAVAFAWTDEWWRGGETVTGWDFGLVDRERAPKPALASVQAAFADVPFPAHERASWPRVSVVVCAYNAAATIDECLTSLEALDYPAFEIIVVNDGSRDDTGAIARRHPRARVIDVPNGGLSAARNIGLTEATSEIVAYTDADVRVDPAWLTYLVQPMLTSDVVGSGGPNVVPADDPFVAQCVARAPGGPTHVLLDDRIAEHVPGCNMAFRRDALVAIGGFNPVYVRAGDDVDICWRLQAKGQRIGFAPAALVWHRHRASVRGYWRQQVGYGEGETWLDAHHPERFLGGQMLWRGHIYSPLPFVRSLSGRRVNTGVWGTAAFPSIYRTEVGGLQFLPHSALWMLAASAACVLGLLGLLSPYKIDATLLGVGGLLAWAVTLGRVADFASASELAGLPGTDTWRGRVRYRALILCLHLLQPLARAHGRVRGMWAPRQEVEPERATGVLWKAPVPSVGHVVRAALLLVGGSVEHAFWSERWVSHGGLLTELSVALRAARPTRRVALDDGWHADRDLGLAVSRWGWLHVRALVEEHEGGRCLCRVGIHLRPSFAGAVAVLAVAVGLAALSSLGATLQWRSLTVVSMITAAVLIVREAWHTTGATALLERSLERVTAAAGMVQVPVVPRARGGRTRVIRLPRTAAQAAQAATIAVVAAGSAASLVSIDRDFTIRERRSAPPPSPRPQPVAAVAAPTGGLAVGPSGDLFLADTRSGRVERLRLRLPLRPTASPAAAARTLFTSVGGFAFPGAADLGLAADGDLLVADPDRSRISRIDVASGRMVTVAGTGAVAFTEDGVQATEAALGAPRGIAVAPNGDLYIADTLNNRVRVVAHASGRIRTIAGDGSPGEGTALGDGGPATRGHLSQPSGVALAPNGDVYVADTGHHRVRRIDAASGLITTVAGTGAPGALGDGGRATLGHLSSPTGVAVAAEGRGVRLYIADTMNDRVRVIDVAGRLSTLGAIAFDRPTRVVYRAPGWVYVKDASPGGVTMAPAKGPPMAVAAAPRRVPPRKMT